jgi:hypothetical protein
MSAGQRRVLRWPHSVATGRGRNCRGVRGARHGIALALAWFAGCATAGPVDSYREGPQFCPRDRAASAPVLTQPQIEARAIELVPGFCGPSFFVAGCEAEPEFVRGDWRVYLHQYQLRDGKRVRDGLDHTYVVLDPRGNCLANIPGTPLGALH